MTEASFGLLGCRDGRPVEPKQIAEKTAERSPIGRCGINVGNLATLWDEIPSGFLVIVGNRDAYDAKGFRMGGELVVSLTDFSASTQCNRGSEEEEIFNRNCLYEQSLATQAVCSELVFFTCSIGFYVNCIVGLYGGVGWRFM